MVSPAAEIAWLTYLLADLHIPIKSVPVLFCDNMSTLHMSVNPAFHARSKHIAIDYHYIREQVALKLLETLFHHPHSWLICLQRLYHYIPLLKILPSLAFVFQAQLAGGY